MRYLLRRQSSNDALVHQSLLRGQRRLINAGMILLLASMFWTGISAAQENEAPLFRMTTRLVQLNVVVLDRHNRPVTDLKKDDFEVWDNGVRQQIAHFSADTVAAPAEPVKRSPLVISNRQPSGDEEPGATVILVDETLLDPQQLGVTSEDMKSPVRQARLLVLQYLSTIKPGQQVALYAMRREGVIVIHDFTDDPSSLVEAAKELGSPSHGKVVTVNDAAGAEQASASLQWSKSDSLKERMAGNGGVEGLHQGMLGAGLRAVARHLEGVPGRKNLVWISADFPMAASQFGVQAMADGVNGNVPLPPGPGSKSLPVPHHADPKSHFDEIQSAARWLGNANIAVYPIDAFGLTFAGTPEYLRASADMIATESGGRAIFDTNGLVQNLQEIVNEGSESYQLGYYPGNSAWDGRYHHIQLKLAPENKGMSILCRKGYYAKDEAVAPTSNAAFRDAATSVVEAPGIGITLNVPINPLSPGDKDLLVKLNVQDIQFDQSSGHANAELDLDFLQLGRDGHVLDEITDDVQIALRLESWSDALEHGWSYPRKIWVDPKAEKLRVVVRDPVTGSVGSVSVPIHKQVGEKGK